MKTKTTKINRRSFLQVTAVAGGGVMIGLVVPSALAQGPRGGGAAAPTYDTYITIHPDNTFTIVAKNPETGQGIRNALPMIIADELDVDWSQVKIQQADLDPKYGQQIEGGSTAIPNNYATMRAVGAAGRALMIAAAAQQLGVDAATLTTGSGVVTHAASGRKATYGSLAAIAAKLPAPTNAPLKDPRNFKIMGQRVPGVDNLAIVTGKPAFSVDVNPQGMLHAVFEKCPVFGGRVVSANVDEIKKLPGIRHAFIVEPPQAAAGGARGGRGGGANWASGVAIVADNWWQANNARKSLRITWDEGATAAQSTTGFNTQAAELAKQSGQAPAGGGQGGANIGDVNAAFNSGAKTVEAAYYFPLLAHAPLEPQNSTAHFNNGKLEIWSPSQIPGVAAPAQAAGITAADVTMHLVRAGGGFGRRLVSEYDIEVAKIARMVADERAAAGQPSVPVKLLWTREDDMHFDNYRPGGYHNFKAALDASGKLVAFRDFVATVTQTPVPANEFPRGFVENFSVTSAPIQPFSIPTGALRAPGTNGTSFAMQGFIDEVAIAAGKDPLQYRLDILNSPVAPPPAPPAAAGAPPAAGGRGGGGGGAAGGFNAARARGVLEAVRDMSDWANRGKLPRGTGKGVAFQYAHAGYVAYVVEVAVDNNKRLKINKAWAAVDIGRQIVNMSMATNLVEGGFIEGMSHIMQWEITIDKGRVQQNNFPQYLPTRMAQVPPAIEVKFVLSDNNPTGLGEPSLPPAVPAITNAIFAATGIRIRTLPLVHQGYAWAT
jgi:isoquinoline 1-oxidoreductase beta subunit